MDAEAIGILVDILRREAGIEVSAERVEFLRARLARRLSAHGLSDLATYVSLVQRDRGERQQLVEALTTHTTSFFREQVQYAWLAGPGLDHLLEDPTIGRSRPLVTWSAAASTGQEGYSALITIEEARQAGRPLGEQRLIGTDISAPVLARAARAIYEEAETQDLPDNLRQRWFMTSRSGDGRLRVVPELRQLATWRRASLTDSGSLDGIEADLVFLRNVLIYFSADTRRLVLRNILDRLRPGGILFTGHTETGAARDDRLVAIAPSIYRKKA